MKFFSALSLFIERLLCGSYSAQQWRRQPKYIPSQTLCSRGKIDNKQTSKLIVKQENIISLFKQANNGWMDGYDCCGKTHSRANRERVLEAAVLVLWSVSTSLKWLFIRDLIMRVRPDVPEEECSWEKEWQIQWPWRGVRLGWNELRGA